MALLFMDSFDHYATADLLEGKYNQNTVSGTGSVNAISAGTGRRSSASFRWTTGTVESPQGYIAHPSGTSHTTAVVGVAFRISGVPSAAGLQILSFWGGTDMQVSLRLNLGLTLSVLRGPHGPGTVLGTTTATLTANTYAYLELQVVFSNTVGTVDLRKDGVSILSLTGLDTQHTATAGWLALFLGQVNNAPSSNLLSRTLDYDDLYLLDGSGPAPWNTFLGDCRVDARYPTAAGATTGWTPSTGANYACVDETAPNDDTDYTSTTTTGATDTFVTEDAPVPGALLYGVQHCLALKKTVADACTVAPVIRHSGVDYPGAAIAPGTSYAYGLQIAATNPGTGAAWTEAGFNAAEFGYTRVS